MLEAKDETNDESPATFVLVCDENAPGDTLELPLEPNGTLAQSTLQAQFPGATGLKYKKDGSDRFRGVRVAEGMIYPPEDGSWTNIAFMATFPRGGKRKADDSENNESNSKEAKTDKSTSDLIVLSLPYKAGESELKEYFSQFGPIVTCDIKRDKDGHSRGFGFVRFAEYSAQDRVLGMRHYIEGRWCDVKIPNSQIAHESNQQPSNCSSRIFVGRLQQGVTDDQLRNFFGKYGPVTDIYLPRPFRSCAFVTFRDISVAQSLVGKELNMDGNTIHIACANPRTKESGSNQHHNNYKQERPYSAGASYGGGRSRHFDGDKSHNMSNGSLTPNEMMNYFGNYG